MFRHACRMGLEASCRSGRPGLDPVLGYGGEGWLWALFGLSHRLLLERPSTAAALRANAPSPAPPQEPMS